MVHKHANDFYVLTVYPATLNLFIRSNYLFFLEEWILQDFLYVRSCYLQTQVIIYFLLIRIAFIYLFLLHYSGTDF